MGASMHDNSIIPARINVRYWHLADIAAEPPNVPFRG